MERTSKVDHEYAGRNVKAGERFDVEPKHVELLLAIGRIEPEEGEPGYQEPTAAEQPAEHTADEPPAAEPTQRRERPRRRGQG